MLPSAEENSRAINDEVGSGEGYLYRTRDVTGGRAVILGGKITSADKNAICEWARRRSGRTLAIYEAIFHPRKLALQVEQLR